MTSIDPKPTRTKRRMAINEPDIKTMGECALLLRQTKNKLAKRVKTVRYDPISEWIGAAIAVIESHARRLENRYHIMKDRNHDQS